MILSRSPEPFSGSELVVLVLNKASFALWTVFSVVSYWNQPVTLVELVPYTYTKPSTPSSEYTSTCLPSTSIVPPFKLSLGLSEGVAGIT